jgi:hypothetical protein
MPLDLSPDIPKSLTKVSEDLFLEQRKEKAWLEMFDSVFFRKYFLRATSGMVLRGSIAAGW